MVGCRARHVKKSIKRVWLWVGHSWRAARSTDEARAEALTVAGLELAHLCTLLAPGDGPPLALHYAHGGGIFPPPQFEQTCRNVTYNVTDASGRNHRQLHYRLFIEEVTRGSTL